MKKIFGIIFFILCFGVSFSIETGNVLSFSIETGNVLVKDVTYNIALEEGYTYGDIQDCPIYVYSGYVQSVSDTASESSYNMCLYTTETAVNHIEKWYGLEDYTCSDSIMDVFKVTVSGSNGATYYGFSCRKPNTIDGIEIVKETIFVGEVFWIPGADLMEFNMCSIIKGDAGHFSDPEDIFHTGNDTLCQFHADKEGVVLVKAILENSETVYYEYNIIKASSSLADLDQNYFYGSVDSCAITIPSSGYVVSDKKNFDSLTFCGSTGDWGELRSLTCVDEGYEAFSLAFYSDDKLYYGYGCRKPKSNDVIDYIEKDMTVGETFSVADDAYNTCSIISGTAGKFDTGLVKYECLFIAEKEGIVEVKAVNNKTNIATYYRIIINANSNDTEYNSSEYKDLICDVKSVLTKKTPDLYKYKIGQIKLSGVLYDIEDIDCSVDIKCDQNDCEYILEQKLKKTANYCSEIYSQGHNYNDGSNYTSRLDECVQFNAFYSSLVTRGLIRDLSSSCKMLSDDFVYILQRILNIIKIAGPLLALGLGTLDFVRTVASGDADKEMKNSFKRFSTRLIAAALLFLVPLTLAFLMDMFLGNQDGYNTNNPFCSIVDWGNQ